MTTLRTVALSALFGIVQTGLAMANDISTKAMVIKDNTDTTKRSVQVQSKDLSVGVGDAGDPGTNGLALHVYSATDDFCATLPGGLEWTTKAGKYWKYKNKATKNSAQIKAGGLKVQIKSGVTYSLLDNTTQGTVNAQVQFGVGTGTRFCMRCTGNKADTAKKFQGKDCVAAACDAEPSSCPPTTTTITSTSTSTSTSTTCPPGPPPALVLKGSLTATQGRFNYNSVVGLPGANAACAAAFAGTHACTYSDLQAAQAACDLPGLKDTALNSVTSFWAIDGAAPILTQCNDDTPVVGSGLNWEYTTAHTLSRGNFVTLSPSGNLGALTLSQCNFGIGVTPHWVGCCQ